MKTSSLFFALVVYVFHGSAVLGETLDRRFQPLIEEAYRLRLAQGALNANMPVDARDVDLTIRHLQSALNVLNEEDEQILPLMAKAYGPNQIVVNRLEEISRLVGRVSRHIGAPDLIRDSKDIQINIKSLLGSAFAMAKGMNQNPLPTVLSPKAEKVLEQLKALAASGEFKNSVDDVLLGTKVQRIVDMVMDDVHDLCDVIEAFEKQMIVYSGAIGIMGVIVDKLYEMAHRQFVDKKVMSKERTILKGGSELLIHRLRETGRIPNQLDVTVVDYDEIENLLAQKLKQKSTNRFFLVAYDGWHAGLIYVDRAAGPLRALVLDSTGPSYGNTFATMVAKALDSWNAPTYVLSTVRQADGANCSTFVLEDLVNVANEPDIFQALKAKDPDPLWYKLLLVLKGATLKEYDADLKCEAKDPRLAISTQILSRLPQEALKNCIVLRKGFAREDRQHFVLRNTHVRLVELQGGVSVQKGQYLFIEKQAADNRMYIMRTQLGVQH